MNQKTLRERCAARGMEYCGFATPRRRMRAGGGFVVDMEWEDGVQLGADVRPANQGGREE